VSRSNPFGLARAFAALSLACAGCAVATPWFYGWGVPFAWAILCVCFASMSHAEAKRVRRSLRMVRTAHAVISRNVQVLRPPPSTSTGG
jgi:uncharacterized protein (DUF697 family)